MTIARAWSVALWGVEGRIVEVEADLAQGLPGLTLVGLPDTAVHESRDRVRAAVVNSGESWPQRRITLSMSPATLPKRGSGFDLALAAAIMAAAGAVPAPALADRVLIGELGLDGRVRPVSGVLPASLAAWRHGFAEVVVPSACAGEASLVPGLVVRPVSRLGDLLALLRGELVDNDDAGDDDGFVARPAGPGALTAACPGVAAPGVAGMAAGPPPDLADVAGQEEARFALEVAAAGGHHLLLLGPPGAGKTMLVERLPGLLPDLDRDAALEATVIRSVVGGLIGGGGLVRRPPFCAPHHTASVAAMVGGGSGSPRPGLVSQAHRGVLFLDEAPEFRPEVLDALRQPLEGGVVVISRAAGTATYPAAFLLAMAANPCACPPGTTDCHCPAQIQRRYLNRLSGPLLDRVDIRLRVEPVRTGDLRAAGGPPEPTARVAARVAGARERAQHRLLGTPWRCNADVPGRELRRSMAPDDGGLRLVEDQLERGRMSARGMDRVLRLAWTLSDLGGSDRPGVDDVGAALALRELGGVAA